MARAPAEGTFTRASAGALFVFLHPEEWIMTQTATKPHPQRAATANANTAERPPAPTIAIRRSCNPDGIGLSHYVLMDRKQAK
jgi:modified peptide precursor CbpA